MQFPEQIFTGSAGDRTVSLRPLEHLVPLQGALSRTQYHKSLVIIKIANEHLKNIFAEVLEGMPHPIIELILAYKPMAHMFPLKIVLEGVVKPKKSKKAKAVASEDCRLMLGEAFVKEGASLSIPPSDRIWMTKRSQIAALLKHAPKSLEDPVAPSPKPPKSKKRKASTELSH